MANKAQAFAQLAENTAKQITGNLAEWTGFLTIVGRLYRYTYYEQLMIYAQRPDAKPELFSVLDSLKQSPHIGKEVKEKPGKYLEVR